MQGDISKYILQDLLKKTSARETAKSSTMKDKQMQEFQRLKDICFPKGREKTSHRDRSYNQIQKSDLPIDKRNASMVLENTRNLSVGRRDSCQSFFIGTNHHNSFNISPLNKRNQTQEFENELSFDKERTAGSPHKILDTFISDTNGSSLYDGAMSFNEKNWVDMKDTKIDETKETYLKIIDKHTTDMIQFVSGLMENLQNISLTKMSEKSVNLMMKKYITKLEGIKEQWQNYSSSEELNGNIKNFMTSLAGCFEEILEKLNDLFQKLKNFNGTQLQKLSNRSVITTYSMVMQQNYDLTASQILTKALSIISHFRASTAIMRINYLLRPKLNSNKLNAFTILKYWSYRQRDTTLDAKYSLGASSIFDFLQRKFWIMQSQGYNNIKLVNMSQGAKEDILMNENQKSLLNSLLNNIHNEPKFFETLNLAVSSLTGYRNAEILLVDKVQRTVFGYPNALKEPPLSLGSENKVIRTLHFSGEDIKDDDEVIIDEIHTLGSERAARKYEFSYEEESIVKYVIYNKEAINSNNLPKISLYNRNIDIPLGNKFSQGTISEFNKIKSQFLYFPLCDPNKAVVGLIRIFFDKEETFEYSVIDRLSKYQNQMKSSFRLCKGIIPVLEQIFALKKKLSYAVSVSKRISAKQESLLKTFFSESFNVLARAFPPHLFEEFSKLIFQTMNVDSLTFYALNPEGRMVKIFSESKSNPTLPDSSVERAQLSATKSKSNKFIGNLTLPIKICNPETGQEIGFIELEKSAYDGQTMNTEMYEISKDPMNQEKYNLSALPEIITDFLSCFGLILLQRVDETSKTAFINTIEALKQQVNSLENFNKTLQEKFNQMEILYEFNAKLRNCTAFEDIVLLFNEVLIKTHFQIDLGTIFFVHPNNNSYFSFNFLTGARSVRQSNEHGSLFTEPLVMFNKGESFIAKVLDGCQNGNNVTINQNPINLHPSISKPYSKGMNGGMKTLDFESENILINFEVALHDEDPQNSNHTFKPRKHPQSIMVIPILIAEKPLAFLTLGQFDIDRSFKEPEEYFFKSVAEIIENFLNDKSKLSTSLHSLTSKLQKSQAKSSKMKAYRALLYNQNLRPEYALYKKHKNLQSFIQFLENTFTNLLNAHACRIFLLNESRGSLYYYTKILSAKIKEFNQVNYSLSGQAIHKNEPFIYPPLHENESLQESTESILSMRSQQKSKGLSSVYYELPEKREASHINLDSISYSITNSSLNLTHASVMNLEKFDHFNPLIDGFDDSYKNNTSPQRKNIKLLTVIFHPIVDSNSKPIGLVQIFNRNDIKRTFSKKDVLKVQAILEGVSEKLGRLMSDPEKLISKTFLSGFKKVVQLEKYAIRKTCRDSFDQIRRRMNRNKMNERRLRELNAGINIIQIVANHKVRKQFECLKVHSIVGKYKQQKKQTESKSEVQRRHECCRIILYAARKLELKEKGKYMKRWTTQLLIRSIQEHEEDRMIETSKMRGILLKNCFHRINCDFKAIGFASIKSRYDRILTKEQFKMSYTKLLYTFTILSKINDSRKRFVFQNIKSVLRGSKVEKNLLKNYLTQSENSKWSLFSYFETIKQYLNELYPDLDKTTMYFIDKKSKTALFSKGKVFEKFGGAEVQSEAIDQLENIMQNGGMTLSNSRSLTDKFERPHPIISYVILDVSHPVLGYQSPYLILENSFNENINHPLSEYSKEYIRLLFLNSLQKTRMTFTSLSTIYKQTPNEIILISRNHKTKVLAKSYSLWKVFLNYGKNTDILNQSSNHFRNVEEQVIHFYFLIQKMVGLEQSLKKYQGDLETYDDKIKVLTNDLKSKDEQNATLIKTVERLMREKRESIRKFSVCRILQLATTQKSRCLTLKSGFIKWKNFLGQSKMATNALKKILKVNHKHITVRISASTVLLQHYYKKGRKEVLSQSFKQLVSYWMSKQLKPVAPPLSEPIYYKKPDSFREPIKESSRHNKLHDINIPSKPAEENVLKENKSTLIRPEIKTEIGRGNPAPEVSKIVKNAFSPLKRLAEPLKNPLKESSSLKNLAKEHGVMNLSMALDQHPFHNEKIIESGQKLAKKILGISPKENHNIMDNKELSFADIDSPARCNAFERSRKLVAEKNYHSTSFDDTLKTGHFKSLDRPVENKRIVLSNNKQFVSLQEKLNSTKKDNKDEIDELFRHPREKKYPKHLEVLDALFNRELDHTKKLTQLN